MDFHEIHPRVAYDLAHVCISWSVQTNKWRTTHITLCVDTMHFSWTDDSPSWILCVSWCQIERTARLRLRKLLHLHAIHDSKRIRVITKLPNSEQSWNKFYCDFKYYFVQYFYTSGEKIFGYEYNSHVTKFRISYD
jgi:hypothetical protein